MTTDANDIDVLIVGAGISGIGMAAHLARQCPDHSYAILERRANLGGTWDLFRYPGIRSDSDMHTLSYEFEPWTGRETLASGKRIQEYLADVTRKYGIADKIRFGTRVISADFSSEQGRWSVIVENEAGRHEIAARFLYLAAGYYDYDEPYAPSFPGEEDFAGTVIHPQHWPEGFDYSGKRVAVIGSGATAITLVPNMAPTAAKVTMVQRTPTYIRSIPGEDRIGQFLRKVLPLKTATRLSRAMRVRLADTMYKTARAKPVKVRETIAQQTKKHLGRHYRAEDHTPPYKPWDQRMCFVPDADLFEAVKEGKVDIVTGHIDRFTPDGILMQDGRAVPADVIVKATGLQLVLGGKIALSVDGGPVVPNEHYFYKNAMLSGVPNLVFPVPYTNTGSTLRYDLLSKYTCRVLAIMRAKGADIAVPEIPSGLELTEEDSFAVEAGYVKRAGAALPKSAQTYPWRLNHDYLVDRRYMAEDPVDDGLLQFRRAGSAAAVPPDREREAAE